ELEAGDLLDEVDLPRDVAGPPGRNHHLAVRAVEAEALQDRLLALGRDLEPEQRVDALRAQSDHRPSRQLALDVHGSGPRRACQLDDQLGRAPGCLLREVRVDAFLPAVRAFRAQTETLRGA